MSLLQHLARAVYDDFRIERELGAGATATVYLAHDLKHDRLVALKVLRPELALAVGAERFLREIRTAAKLSHPGILPLYDSGEADGLLFFTMPVAQGESLRQRLERDGPMPIDQAVRVASDVARALGFAHERGVIHRDIKPENILLEDGRALVADFGIALVEDRESARLTQTGVAIGTPYYMSPEQAGGSVSIDHRSDIYSLACVLYEMISGRPPFDGPTSQAIVAQQICDPAPPIRELRPDIPAAVESSLEQALAKNPAERFQTAEGFAAALVDPSRRRPRRRNGGRAGWRWAGAAAAVCALLLAGALAVARPFRAPLRERDWVLVADFEGPRADPALAGAVRELVTTELNQSRRVTTMPRQQLAGTIRAAGLPDSTTVNIDLARELAFRSAVRAVIGGRIDSAGRGYRLTVRVVDAADGRELVSVSADASADSMVHAVQQLARRVRQQLGERRRDLEANQLLLDIATPSLPAYRKYVDALARKQRGDVAGSTRVLLEASALDTGFAAAWALMGMNYVEARNLDSARIAFGEALRRPARLSRAQHYRLLADAAYTTEHDLPAAIRWYDEYLKETPRSIGGRNNRGLYLSLLGRYQEALADFEQAASNNPFGPDQAQPAIMNATDMLIVLGQLDRASAKARELTGAYAQYADLRILTVSGRWEAAESLAAQVLAAPGTPPALRVEAITARAGALANRGSVVEADRVLAEAASQAAGAPRRWYEAARSLLALTSGHRRLDRGTVMVADTAPGTLIARGVRLALLGDTLGARSAARRARDLPLLEQARLGYGALAIDALVDARAGRWEPVVRALAGAALTGEHDATSLDRAPSLTLRWLVADAYAHLGRLDSAMSYMNLALTSERVPSGHLVLRGLAYPFGKRQLARWQAQQGDHAVASR
jgi:tetratricopeptide (TPR) repeat protein/tRNA A-37 threonylcarbamoyl transferase component Bud32